MNLRDWTNDKWNDISPMNPDKLDIAKELQAGGFSAEQASVLAKQPAQIVENENQHLVTRNYLKAGIAGLGSRNENGQKNYRDGKRFENKN